MSLFKKATSRPAFGVVASTANPATPTAPAAPPVDLAAYGLTDQIDPKRPGPTPALDEARRLAGLGDWRAISAFLASMDLRSDTRMESISAIGDTAVNDDEWLRQWLAAEPENVTALSIYGDSLVKLAWEIRTSKSANQVSKVQWDGFFRVLRQVPDICHHAAALDPADPAPLAMLLAAAKGLQWEHDDFRALYAELTRRAPRAFTPASWAMSYWFPRWYGSKELLSDFVENAIAAAPDGCLLTTLRLDVLYTEFRPEDKAERQAYYKSEAVNAAIDASLADLAAADPAHPKLPSLRHWLAYWLYLNDRSEEALAMFQAIGGYCGARPWNTFNDYQNFFIKARIRTIREVELGRPDAHGG